MRSEELSCRIPVSSSHRNLPLRSGPVQTPIRNISLAIAVVLTLAACGGNGANDVTTMSIVEPPAELLVTPDEIGRQQPGSAGRAFLRYWSALQYSAWTVAIGHYDPRFVRLVGLPRFIDAMRAQASYFRTAKPKLGRTQRDERQAVVRYSIRGFDGRPMSTSTTWKQTGEKWQVLYDPQLDVILQSYAQNEAQARIDPNARTHSKEALEAGRRAAQLQSRFLELSNQEIAGG
jgi:hypothetical protein